MGEHLDAVTIFWSYEDALSDIDDEAVELAVRRAIMQYAFTGEAPELTGTASALFKLMRPNIDNSRARAINGGRTKGNPKQKAAKDQPEAVQNDARSEAEAYQDNTRGGAEAYQDNTRGGAEAYQDNTRGGAEAYQEHTKGGAEAYQEHTRGGAEAYQEHTNKDKGVGSRDKGVGSRDKGVGSRDTGESVGAPDGASPAPVSKPGRNKRFVKPSADEVREYAASRGAVDFDAQHFVDYYDSNGWKVGRNPMKDWKAAVRTWLARDGDGHTPVRASPGSRRSSKDIYHDYSQELAEIEAHDRETGWSAAASM